MGQNQNNVRDVCAGVGVWVFFHSMTSYAPPSLSISASRESSPLLSYGAYCDQEDTGTGQDPEDTGKGESYGRSI